MKIIIPKTDADWQPQGVCRGIHPHEADYPGVAIEIHGNNNHNYDDVQLYHQGLYLQSYYPYKFQFVGWVTHDEDDYE